MRVCLSLILRVVFDACLCKGFLSFYACTALAAVLLAALVTAPCLGVVDAKAFADACDVTLGYGCVGGNDVYVVERSGCGGSVDGVDEFRAAVWIDRVIAAVVGDEHLIEPVAFGDTNGNG